MVTYAGVAIKKNELIRRARDGSVFIAEKTVTGFTTLTSGTGALVALPAGWKDLGWTSSDGVTFGRETDSSQIRSFGSAEPTREDITSDTVTMQVTAQETSALTIGLTTGVDVSALTATTGTAEFTVSKPNIPAPRSYRILGLFVDQTSDGEIYFARYMPNARITEYGDAVFSSDGDDPIQYQLTFTAFADSTVGYSHRWIWGGPGWKALTTQMGITVAP